MNKIFVLDVANLQFRAIFNYRSNPKIPATYTFMSMITGYFNRLNIDLSDTIIMAQDFSSWRKAEEPCITEDCDILTNIGWINIKEYIKNKYIYAIATLNVNKNCVEYKTPNNWYEYWYEGEMIHIGGETSSRIDLITTPEHLNYCTNKKSHNFELRKSKDLSKSSMRYNREFNYRNNKKIKYYIIPHFRTKNIHPRKNAIYTYIVDYPKRILKINDWIRLFGWYITEGCIGGRKYRKVIEKITIGQSEKHNPKYVKEIRKMLYRLKLPVTEQKRKNKVISFNILDTQLATYLSKFGKSHDKYIPRELLDRLSKKQCKFLLKTMLKGDGTKRGFNNYAYTTTSNKLADDVQELALKSGFTATRSKKYSGKGTEFYFVYIHKIPYIEAPKRIIKNWSGYTYDLEVPNHIFYIRRNGKCCWTGNCYKAQREENRIKQEEKSWWSARYEEFNQLYKKLDMSLPYHWIKIWLVEADDIASVVCSYYKDKEIILISSDADWEQLAYFPNVKIFSPISKKFKEIKNPVKLLLSKIEKGDKSDNLTEKVNSEIDFEHRKKLVDLISPLPENIENQIKEALSQIKPKNLYVYKIPFNYIQQKFKKIYNLT
jgi:hypothetical protein